MARKTKKITKAPSGVSFTHAPQAPYGATTCPDCGKGEVVMARGSFPTCNGGAHFACSNRCGWKSASGEFQHTSTAKTLHHVASGVVKKHPQKKMPRDLRDAVRAEVTRRREILTAEREQFPPSLIQKRVKITKSKNKGKLRTVNVTNPKFTDEMRSHMHRFYVSSEEIHDALKAGKKLPEYPVAS